MTTHLDAITAEKLALSKAERSDLLLKDRFIQHERLQPVIDHIDYLRFMPPKSRAEGLMVYGPPGSGKSMLRRWIERRYPREKPVGGTRAVTPVISIEMTGAREAKVLYERLLEKLGDPDPCRHKGSARENMVMKLAKAAEVRLLVVDEIQDLLTSTVRQQRFALDTIKLLMNELRIPIILLGTEEAPDALTVDKHLNARFEMRELPTWRSDTFLANFLGALERTLPLAKPSVLASPTIRGVLVEVSGGNLDAIVRLVTRAAAFAIDDASEQITESLIRKAQVFVPAQAVEHGRARWSEAKVA